MTGSQAVYFILPRPQPEKTTTAPCSSPQPHGAGFQRQLARFMPAASPSYPPPPEQRAGGEDGDGIDGSGSDSGSGSSSGSGGTGGTGGTGGGDSSGRSGDISDSGDSSGDSCGVERLKLVPHWSEASWLVKKLVVGTCVRVCVCVCARVCVWLCVNGCVCVCVRVYV